MGVPQWGAANLVMRLQTKRRRRKKDIRRESTGRSKTPTRFTSPELAVRVSVSVTRVSYSKTQKNTISTVRSMDIHQITLTSLRLILQVQRHEITQGSTGK